MRFETLCEAKQTIQLLRSADAKKRCEVGDNLEASGDSTREYAKKKTSMRL